MLRDVGGTDDDWRTTGRTGRERTTTGWMDRGRSRATERTTRRRTDRHWTTMALERIQRDGHVGTDVRGCFSFDGNSYFVFVCCGGCYNWFVNIPFVRV